MNILKKALWSFLIFFILLNLVIIFSGKTYLYKGFVNTYMLGRSGPSISEYHIFSNRTVEATNPEPWKYRWERGENAKHGVLQMNEGDVKTLDSIQTVAFLVANSKELLFEKYFEPYSPDSITNSFSAAKSIVGLLVGKALEEGHIKSLDQTAGYFIPSMNEEGKQMITIRHLLTMSSGLNWSESGKNPISDNAEAYYGTNLKRQIDRLEIIDEPGQNFVYLSGNTQILGMILTEATGMPLAEYAQTRLWSQIGAESDALWNLDYEDGFEKAYCCFYATARDFARIGKLINQKGAWNGEQLFPEEYIEEMLTPADLRDGLSDNQRYGYQWWVERYMGMDVYYARGILGQYIISIPDKDLVIVRTGHTRMKENDRGHPEDLYIYIDIAMDLIYGF